MLKELVKLANHLDSIGHSDLSDKLDSVIRKMAEEVAEPLREQKYPSDTVKQIQRLIGADETGFWTDVISAPYKLGAFMRRYEDQIVGPSTKGKGLVPEHVARNSGAVDDILKRGPIGFGWIGSEGLIEGRTWKDWLKFLEGISSADRRLSQLHQTTPPMNPNAPPEFLDPGPRPINGTWAENLDWGEAEMKYRHQEDKKRQAKEAEREAQEMQGKGGETQKDTGIGFDWGYDYGGESKRIIERAPPPLK